MFSRLWAGYNRALDTRPLLTKTVMSIVVLGAADVGAQGLQHRQQVALHDKKAATQHAEEPQPFSLDMTRQRAVWTYATWFQGPFGHWWYNFLEGTVATKVPPHWIIATKMVCDQMVNATLSNVIYFSYIPWFEGKPVDEIRQKLRMDLGPTYLIDCLFWPVFGYFNFRFVPVQHQLLACNGVLLVWTLFMSYVCHDDAVLRRFDKWNVFLTDDDRKVLKSKEDEDEDEDE